ncbi:MAG: pyridoxamine 5'-phosphate oxidase [Leptolyngbya sp. SIO3F4]|nr:pyridoxamine 5'-phosphate oxidase [Leptolyngbya sp. SIO3F4]
MTLAPWRPPLAQALHRNRARANCRYLQLATINQQGKPSNRTLVFRGFIGEALQMVTDGRSEKVEQIHLCPWAEVCWYFTVTREQFRIAGKLTVIEASQPITSDNTESIRLNAWKALSNKARQQFYWPHPGKHRASENAFEALPPEQSLETPTDSFYVLLLTADRVDHLALRGTPQDRQIYERVDEQWLVKNVNP